MNKPIPDEELDRYRPDHVQALVDEVKTLRAAIRHHRDQKGDDRCWVDDDILYRVLPETVVADYTLPPKDEFLTSCARYWHQRQTHIGPCATGMTIAQLESENARLKALVGDHDS